VESLRFSGFSTEHQPSVADNPRDQGGEKHRHDGAIHDFRSGIERKICDEDGRGEAYPCKESGVHHMPPRHPQRKLVSLAVKILVPLSYQSHALGRDRIFVGPGRFLNKLVN